MFLQLRFFVLILLAALQFSIRAQNDSTSLFKPYLLSNHPFGMFTSRINHNFNLQATQKKTSLSVFQEEMYGCQSLPIKYRFIKQIETFYQNTNGTTETTKSPVETSPILKHVPSKQMVFSRVIISN